MFLSIPLSQFRPLNSEPQCPARRKDPETPPRSPPDWLLHLGWASPTGHALTEQYSFFGCRLRNRGRNTEAGAFRYHGNSVRTSGLHEWGYDCEFSDFVLASGYAGPGSSRLDCKEGGGTLTFRSLQEQSIHATYTCRGSLRAPPGLMRLRAELGRM